MATRKTTGMPKNVSDFLFKSGDLAGRAYSETFTQRLWGECCNIESPIEQIFKIAFETVAEVNYFAVSDDEDNNDAGSLLLIPQYEIKPYRADFFCSFVSIDGNKSANKVLIECDGHAFHDKDKRQRAYEKRRERDLQRLGFKVFRFTGSEIVAAPYTCAIEIISLFAGDGLISPLELDD